MEHAFPKFCSTGLPTTDGTLMWRWPLAELATVKAAPAVAVEAPVHHQLMHPCGIHRRQGCLLAEDSQTTMSGTLYYQLHSRLDTQRSRRDKLSLERTPCHLHPIRSQYPAGSRGSYTSLGNQGHPAKLAGQSAVRNTHICFLERLAVA